MSLSPFDFLAVAAALTAIFMAGSAHIYRNLFFYRIQTLLLGGATALLAYSYNEPHLYYIAAAISLIKGCGIPAFLRWIVRKLKVFTDPGIMLAPPLAMHLSIILFALSYFEVGSLGQLHGSVLAASSAISLLLTGLVLMLTRRIALSQIVGFLIIENGIYLFAMTQTRGMPMIVEMGVMLDVLAGVMIAGLVLFRIQRSFEHIDVTQLTELRD